MRYIRTKMTNNESWSAKHLYGLVAEASQADKRGLLLQFLRAAISERERGDLEPWQVGSQVLTLIGGIDFPSTKLQEKLTSEEKVTDKLHATAGQLGMTAQGGTSPVEDESLWWLFKSLVDEYETIQARNSSAA
jgi:hypothetical protein